MICLKCINEKCGYSYSVTVAELKNNGRYHSHCKICGEKIKVANIDEIVSQDIKAKVENYISKCFKLYGLEYTMEIVEHLQKGTVKELYKKELKRRGL